MSLPRYPGYKNSGVEWLGQLPAHWQLRRLRLLCDIQTGGKDTENSLEGGEFPFFVRSQTVQRIDSYSFDCEAILTAGDGAGVGKVFHHVEGKFDFHQRVYMLHTFRQVLGRYLYHFLVGNFYKVALQGGAKSTVDSLRRPMFTEFPVAVPPSEEQSAVISFLDRETQKIDTFISEQQRLIELLKEKRQAAISHAVTKGLNPDARMKPSGLDWLGDIPAHWDVIQSRRLFAVRNEPARGTDQQLTASQKHGMIYQSDFVELEGRRVVEIIRGTDSLRHAEPNDFVISLRSFQGGLEWCKLPGSITFHYVVLTPVKRVYEPFFSYLFKSQSYIQALRSTANLIRDGQDLRYSNFVQVALPLVPMEEQAIIADYLDQEVRRIDELAAEADNSVALLQERRTGLISAAVTGQIDVRGLVEEQIT